MAYICQFVMLVSNCEIIKMKTLKFCQNVRHNSQLYENARSASRDFIRIYRTVLLYYFGGENENVLYTRHFFQLGLVEKFYENGQKFLTMFPDGTGNILYPFLYMNYSVI